MNMSTTSIQSTQTANPIQDLAAAITKKLDVDGDGNLSSVEFSNFLTQFLGALLKQPTAASSSSTASSATSAAETPAVERKVVGTMAGYDNAKLGDLTHTTTKYTMGRIFQYYPNTPAGLREALPEIQQIVPQAKIVGSKGDKLDFGDYVDARGNKIGVIDVIAAAGDGGTAWHWEPVE
jgi:hypothetical protein